jgi:hypothetical protein
VDDTAVIRGLDALGFAEVSTMAISIKPKAGRKRDVAGWEARLAKLEAYKRRHGDCNVPQGWGENPGLGTWVNNQRAYKRKLDRGEPSEGMTVAREARLDAVGFTWETQLATWEASWEAQLAKLEAYKCKHGDCNVPRGWAEDPGLSNWVNNQRQCKGKLDRGEPSEGMTVARAARLDAVGFAWVGGLMGDAGWEAQLAKLKAYRSEHGDCSVPQGWAEDPRLGMWISTQRQCKRKLDRGETSEGMTAARVAKLTALGFAWELSAAAISKQISKRNRDDAGWEAKLAKLKAYKSEHGDCSVPQGWAEDPGLGNWVNNQRQCKRKLDRGEPSQGMAAARVARLDAVGFAWGKKHY